MSIYYELCKMPAPEEADVALMMSQMADNYTLGAVLEKMEIPEETLPYLRLELMTKQRVSTISRIYGRYRKLLPKRDFHLIEQWRLKHGRKREEG